MKELILHPTDISQWYTLVTDAEVYTQLSLDENTESYLVFLLQRFSHTPQLIESVLATDFLESMHVVGKQRIDSLRGVGDKSLLLCGLFPGIATRRHLSLDYYAGIGKAAYTTLSHLQKEPFSTLFHELSNRFFCMQKILQAIRGEYHQLDSINLHNIQLNDDPHVH